MKFVLEMAVREIRSRPGRSLLALVSIVIGVATVTAVSLTTTSAQQGLRQMDAATGGPAVLEVVSADGKVFPVADFPEAVRSVPGVLKTIPQLTYNALMTFRSEQVGVVVFSETDVGDNLSETDYVLREGRLIQAENEALLELSLARGLNLPVGETVQFRTLLGTRPITIVGLVARRAAGVLEGGFLFLPSSSAGKWNRMANRATVMQLRLDPAFAPADVQAEVAKLLPEGLQVQQPISRAAMAEETMGQILHGLNLSWLMSLVMASFVILNTFLMNITERRRQLSIARSIGATRTQVLSQVLIESLILGVVGTVLGELLGVLGAKALLAAFEQLLWGTLPPLRITVWPFVIAGLLGPVVAVLGAFVPAQFAARLSPLEGTLDLKSAGATKSERFFLALGALLTAAACAVLGGTIFGWLPVDALIPGIVLAIVGVVLLMPLILSAVVSALQAAFGRTGGFVNELARLNVVRRRTRSALTAGVLFVATASGFSMGNTVINNVRDVQDWYERTIGCDFLLRAHRPNLRGETADIPPEVEQQLRELPGVTDLDATRLLIVEVNDSSVTLIATGADDPSRRIDLKVGDPAGLDDRLKQGEIVVSTMLATRQNLKIGDTVRLAFHDHEADARIAGICADYMVGGLTIYGHRQAIERLLGVPGADVYLINTEPGNDAIGPQLRKIATESGLLLQPFAEMKQMIDNTKNGAIGMIWGVLVFGFVLAVLGVINTLTMNVSEQIREISLLRAGGMTRGQAHRYVIMQGLLLGLVGIVGGLVGGCALAIVISLCTLSLFGHMVPFTLHYWLLFACCAVGMAIVFAASWIPARSSTALPLVEALKSE